MKESKRRRSLSGAVLVMILTVMFVLIILLTATLTTVTTANQRIYTKFEENQAYYTARSALDVFTLNMLSDANYIAQDSGNRQYIHGDNDHADMKQGLGLQIDLYSITAQSGHNVKQSDFNSYASTITDPDDKKDEYKNYFGTDSTKVKNNGKPVTDPDYKEFVTYEVELPATADASSQYGKLADGLKATVTVEVLERKYNLGTYTSGGVETSIPDADVEDFINKTGSYTTVTDTMIAEAVANGNRKKDTMRVKITATTIFDGVEGTAVLILDSNEPPVNNSSRAITAFGSALGTNHAYIVGGMSMVGTPGADIPWSNGGGVYGTVYNEAGLNFNVATPIFLTESEYVFVAGDLKGNNDMEITASVTDTDKNKRPFIYVGGSFAPNNNFSKVGGSTATEKVDLITHGISWVGGNSFIYNGDIYSDGNCTFNSSAGSPSISGDLYIKGNLDVGGNVASDDGSGNLTVNFGSCNIYLSGDVYYNGMLYPMGTVFNSDPLYTVSTFSAGSMSIPSITDVTDVSSGALNVEVTLPGSIKKQIDTHKTNYDNYYVLDEHGNYVDVDGDGNTPDRQTAMDMAGVDFTQASFLPADSLTAENGATVSIDTTADPTKYVLYGGQNFNGSKIMISGGGTVELILKPSPWSWDGNYNSGNGHLDIIVDDDTTLKIYGGDANKEYTLNTVSVWTQTTYDAYKNHTTLNVGNQTGHNIKVPKIYYYFSGGKVNLSNGRCFLTGYFFGPTTELNATAGSNITFTDLKYNGASVPSGWRYTVLGSVLCDDFNLQNDHGIIYVNPDLDDDTPGEPIHQWQSYQYVRS
ncbi:MAG: hypothetical protein HDT25_07750 [Ruminococcus sp.]|nr:hypothetical protein [Ruminococcus sp.]